MAEVRWSDRALADLDAVADYIGQFRPVTARRMAERLWSAAESLALFPQQGRSFGNIRELVVVYPYVIRYRLIPGGVEIVRIKHGAQRL